MKEDFDKKIWLNNFGKKSWRQLDEIIGQARHLSQNHINCYVDYEKTTSKVVCGYAYRSYGLTNVFKIEQVSEELPGDGVGFIYSKNVAFKMLKIYQKYSANYFYMDNSYFSKHFDKKITKFRISVNDIHPHKYCEDVDVVHNISLSPWKKRDDSDLYILLCPPTGEILGIFGLKKNWLEKTIEKIRAKTQRAILIRFKNYDFMTEDNLKKFSRIQKQYSNIFFDKEITEANLIDLFEDCYAVVAPASGVGVIAATYGIPVFSENIGPVASISVHDYSLINYPNYPDRNIWLNTILSHEFTLDEVFSGQWLVRLKKIYPKELKRILNDQINLL
jgi:hypothetical protein